ncbi:MAG: YihA family ribosome biogenesis GTP-binding protein [Bacteroidaceae bacterium]|jgi:GTP-binding protein|nr:YihA family ribosome biogenesis GTP-binding protein [Bacteroidaceae bacterium]MBQ2181444.1 YihA family ribosome biogenesis GTP-binding protein [Bacteroidaceae bacterium]MBQ5460658.1 YihA family ribosome biogenesis GTP-binding protein [Bacteroidaceae bacterium]
MIINSAEFQCSSPRADMCPQTDLPEYAFIGRSNVGKSSLINMLTGRNKLAMTSSTPGKTMLVNHFIINKEWYLVDLPGYGFAQRGKREMDKLWNLISHYVLEREQLTCLFVLIDIRHEPQQKDLDFFQFLGENGVPFAIIFTKADKISRQKIQSSVKAYLNVLGEMWEELPPHFITSATSKMGKDDVLNYIDEINKNL